MVEMLKRVQDKKDAAAIPIANSIKLKIPINKKSIPMRCLFTKSMITRGAAEQFGAQRKKLSINYSFNILQSLSFNSVKPCCATDEINI